MSVKVRNFTWCQVPAVQCAVHTGHSWASQQAGGGLMVDKDGSTDGDRRQLECCG